MSVNDDAIALKGGKGPWADTDDCNGENINILIEKCNFGFCHSALTCGSESIHKQEQVMRDCRIDQAMRVLWLKMRPDILRNMSIFTVGNITVKHIADIYQTMDPVLDLKGRKDIPVSYSENIDIRNIDLKCKMFFDVAITENDRLSYFTFEDLSIDAENDTFDRMSFRDLPSGM